MTPLEKIRIGRKHSIYDVANAAGCAPSTISRIEKMKGRASPEMAEKISNFFEGEITEEQILYPHRFIEQVNQPS